MFPIWFIILGIVVYLIAYFGYSKWYNKNVWEPDPERTTPAHEYMDGIRFFPVSKYVLYGFQFKGIAGLGPIFGPFIALYYGWLPALIWILAGNFFIGWIHDYSSLFMSVREEGRTMGPLTHELISPRARKGLIGFLWFYLILITATFVYICSTFFRVFPTSRLAMFLLLIGGAVSGALIYKLRKGPGIATGAGVAITIAGIVLGQYIPLKFIDLGSKTANYAFWIIITSIILWISAATRLLDFTQPTIYLGSYPAIAGIIMLVIGLLGSPITNVPIQVSAFRGFLGPPGTGFWAGPGPLWPMLMVSIACGAISGWHSLVSTSGSAGQLDVETDALPVGGGSMLMEGLLALVSLGAFMVVAPTTLAKLGKPGGIVVGATKLVGGVFGGKSYLKGFYAMWLELFALTIEMLVMRFFTLVMKQGLRGQPRLRLALGNKFVAPIIVLAIAGVFAYTGSWLNLWLLFGGSNQLLAGLALTLVSIYLVKKKKPSIYTLIPAIFMVITCEAALAYETASFFHAVWAYLSTGNAGKLLTSGLVAKYPGVSAGLNVAFGIIGVILFIIGGLVAYDGFKAIGKARKGKTE